jgi:oxygen-independent coproporphyrinogen-3 oxidase
MGLSGKRESNETQIPEVFEPYCGLYPGIASFTPEFDVTDYREWVLRSNGDPVPAPLMLVVQNAAQADPVVYQEDSACQLPWYSAVAREIQLQGELFDADRPLEGVVLAPGIAASWSNDALYELSTSIQNAFSVTPASYMRWCACFGRSRPSPARLQLLRVLGFSKVRLCLDLSSPDQGGEELYREIEQTEQLLDELRNLGYRSLAIDLVLPVKPDNRLVKSIENLLVKTRVECIRLISASGPDGALSGGESSAFLKEFLQGLGYRHIGLDWYVTESEPSLGQGARLHWSPLGYTDIEGLDVIGVGPGAVSVLEDAYSQNAVRREDYQRMVAQGEIPTERGVELESDDSLRRTVMYGILVNEHFNIEALENCWGIMFPQYFESEVALLRTLQAEGKLVLGEHEIHTLERGRNALISLCRIFDNQSRIARVPPLREVH